jgi:hypothetical protein
MAAEKATSESFDRIANNGSSILSRFTRGPASAIDIEVGLFKKSKHFAGSRMTSGKEL